MKKVLSNQLTEMMNLFEKIKAVQRKYRNNSHALITFFLAAPSKPAKIQNFPIIWNQLQFFG